MVITRARLLLLLPLLLPACGEEGVEGPDLPNEGVLQQAVQPTGLNLETWDPGSLSNESRLAVRLTNWSSSPIQLSRIKLRAWLRYAGPSSDPLIGTSWSANSELRTASGAWVANVAAPSVSFSTVSPENVCSSSRRANKRVTIGFSDSLSIPANGGYLQTIPGGSNVIGSWHRQSWQPIDRSLDYSKPLDGGTSAATRKNLEEFTVELDGATVCETVASGVSDSKTGKSPCYQNLCAPPPSGTGGTSGTSGGATGGGTAGSGGTAGASGGTGGSPGGGTAGTGGAGGSSGAGTGGTSGTGGTGGTSALTYSFHVDTAKGVAPSDVVLASYGSGYLKVKDKVDLLLESGPGFSSTSSVDDAFPVLFGPYVDVQNVWAATTAGVSLGSNARIHGKIESEGPVLVAPGAIIDGTTNQAAELHPFERKSWTVTFPPAITDPTTVVQPFQVESAQPEARYGNVVVKGNGRLKLSGRTYFDSLAVEPYGKLEVLNGQSAVLVFVRGDLTFDGVYIDAAPTPNVLFGIAGTASSSGDATLGAPFRGTVLAPFGKITLRACNGGHVGSFFGKKIEAEPSFFSTMPIKHRPVDFPALCSALPVGEQSVCSVFCPCGPGDPGCESDQDCEDGTFCADGAGPRFDLPQGTNVCIDDGCLDPASGLTCGPPDSDCGRCTNDPRECVSDLDCLEGEICGTDNGSRFGLLSTADVCWADGCSSSPDATGMCGSVHSECGECTCLPSCEGKVCGEDASDGCGGSCPGLCGNGDPGCASDRDCPPGSACGIGVGPRFGFAEGTNVCWELACTRQDPSLPDCGVDPTRCGSCPACLPTCDQGATVPDGCGGFCGACAAGETRLPNGRCEALALLSEALDDYPIPLTPLLTDPVGATSGTFLVTQRGTASYTIPIQVPPGRLGMQPSLALSYTSTKDNGPLGVGWTIAGVSSISRCPSIFDREGITRPVLFDDEDRFCLDGAALIQVPDGDLPYGANGAEYRTEIDSFARVISHDQVEDGLAVAGTGWFEVFAKDGRILTYGLSNDSSVFTSPRPGTSINTKRIWALDSVRDRSGNTLEIRYRSHQAIGSARGVPGPIAGDVVNETGEIVPDLISYGGTDASAGTSLPHTRFVKFDYEDRPEPRYSYAWGERSFTTLRLRSIETYVGADLVRTYRAGYVQNNTDNQTRLRSVVECAPDGSEEACLEPTTFGYWDTTPFTSLAPPLPTLSAPDFAYPATFVLDANGDGRDEILDLDRIGSNPSGSAVDGGGSWLLSNPRSGTAVEQALYASVKCIGSDSVMDVNRDGKDDIVDKCPGGDPASNSGDMLAYLSTGTGFVPTTIGGGIQFYGRLKLADLDGNGLRDIAVCENGSRYQDELAGTHEVTAILLNQGTSFIELAELRANPPPGGLPPGVEMLPSTLAGTGPCKDLVGFDVNGDGREDLVQFKGAQGIEVFDPPAGWVQYGELPDIIRPGAPAYKLVDANGDGLKDLTYLDRETRLVIAFNTGSAFSGGFVPAPVEDTFQSDYLRAEGFFAFAQVLDYDGDGREDLVSNSGIVRFPDDGQRTMELIDFDSDLEGILRTAGDIDGDGSLDLVPDISAIEHSDMAQPIHIVGQSARAGLLREIFDGNKKWTTVMYSAGEALVSSDDVQPDRTYDDSGCISDNTSFRSTCLRQVTPLVSAHFELQVRADETFVGPGYTYRYEDARMGLGGRGWYGFAQRTVTLETLWTNRVQYLNNDFFFAGRPFFSEHRFAQTASTAVALNSQRVVITTLNWEPYNGDFVQFPFPTGQTQVVFEEGVSGPPHSVFTATRTPDEFGTPVTETIETRTAVLSTTSVASVSVVNTTQDVENDPSEWLLGRVTDVTTDATRGGSSSSRSQHLVYHPGTHLLLSAERQPDPALPSQPDPTRPTEYQKATFDRDGFGNMTKTCVTDSRGQSFERCREVTEFDPDHIFPTRVRDPEGLESQLLYSVRFGEPLWIEDANGIVSEQALDAFGRMQQFRTPTSEGTLSYIDVSEVPQGTFASPIPVRATFGVVTQLEGQESSTLFFDAFGRVVQELVPGFVPAGPIQMEHEYDHLGREIRTTLPHLVVDPPFVVESTYDGAGRLSSRTYPGNLTERFYYPAVHNVSPAFASWFAATPGIDMPATGVVVEKPRGNLEARLFDSHGNPVRSVSAPGLSPEGGAVTDYHYAAFDDLVQVDTALASTFIVSDGLGRAVSLDDPALGEQTTTYNGFDEVVTATDANLVTIVNSYDAKGRLLDTHDANTGDLIVKRVYGGTGPNELGRLVGAYRQSEPGASTGSWVRYHYQPAPSDGVNRGLSESVEYGLGGSPDDIESGEHFSVGFEYQATVPWRLDILSYPDQGGAFYVQYDYSSSSGVLKAVHPPGNPESPYWQLVETANGYLPSLETFGNGLETRRDYYDFPTDMADCPVDTDTSCLPGALRGILTQRADQSSPAIQDVGYRYDRNGNISGSVDATSAARSRVYQHDGFDRLALEYEADGTTVVSEYTYDLVGNIRSKTGLGIYDYDDPNHPFHVTQAGGTSYVPDDAGNLVERTGAGVPGGSQELSYDAFSRPQQVTTGDDVATPAFATEFEYDGSGDRLVKRRRAGSEPNDPVAELTLTIMDIYEQASEFAVPSATPSSVRHKYRIYAAGKQVAQLERREAGGSFDPERTYYLHGDQLGSISFVTDEDGEPETREYTPFGETLGVNFTSSGVLSGFTGHQHDPDLGLVNMRGRLYDARLGRFVTPDPFVTEPLDTQGLNRYSYVQNNPLGFTDPSGFSQNPFGTPSIPPPPGTTGIYLSSSGQASGPPPGPPPGVTGRGHYHAIPGEGHDFGGEYGESAWFWISDESPELPTTTAQATHTPHGPGSSSWTAGHSGGDSSQARGFFAPPRFFAPPQTSPTPVASPGAGPKTPPGTPARGPGLGLVAVSVLLERDSSGPEYPLTDTGGAGARPPSGAGGASGVDEAPEEPQEGRSGAGRGTPKLLNTARGNLLSSAEHRGLRNLISQMYRPNARAGSGSTADAIRHESATGELLSPKGHFIKGQEMRTALTRLLKSGELGPADQQIARQLLGDLQGALSGQ